MRLTIVRGGGLGGFSTRTELDAAKLPADAAQAYAGKLRAAAGAQSRGAAPAHPDETSYELTIDAGGGPKVLRFTESTLPEEIRQLIAWVDSRPERVDRLSPPGH
jgi:hypothetical protein